MGGGVFDGFGGFFFLAELLAPPGDLGIFGHGRERESLIFPTIENERFDTEPHNAAVKALLFIHGGVTNGNANDVTGFAKFENLAGMTEPKRVRHFIGPEAFLAMRKEPCGFELGWVGAFHRHL